MPTNIELAKQVEGLREEVEKLDTELCDKEAYNSDNITALFERVMNLEKLLIIVCASHGDFIREPGTPVFNFNLHKKLERMLTMLPRVSEVMKD